MKLDSIVVQKILEEMYNSDLIHIKSDEKFIQLYELRKPIDETISLINNMDGKNGYTLDSYMKLWLQL
jgi:hypothetical protein